MRKLALLVAVGILVAALVLVPMPLLQLRPGGAIPVADGIEVDADIDPLEGELLLTTVRLSEVTAVEAVQAWLDDDERLIDRDDYLPEGIDADRYGRLQERVFAESVRVAAAVAQRAAGLDVTISGDGALVVAVLEGTPAEQALDVGDVITEIDGRAVELASDIGSAIAGAGPGEVVSLLVERDGGTRTVDVELEDIGELERAGIGVAVQSIGREIDLPVDVERTVGGIGGPSAGLMLALTVYDMIEPVDLAGGRRVAGTGTIAADGSVGPVSGVEQKVAAAIEADASVFVVPVELADDARSAAGPGLEVVAVSTFDEARRALLVTAG